MYVVLLNILIIFYKDSMDDYCLYLIIVFYICKCFGLVFYYLNVFFLVLYLVGGNGIIKYGKIV